VGQNKQPTTTEQRRHSDFQLSEANASNGSTVAPSDSSTIVSDEPVASTTLLVLSSKLVLTGNLSPLPSISKQVINFGRPRCGWLLWWHVSKKTVEENVDKI
jgi:hypothetical protein